MTKLGGVTLIGAPFHRVTRQVSYSFSHLAAFLFGLALPRRDRLSWIVAVLLFTYAAVSTLAFAIQPLGLVRILLMWLLVALGGWLALRESKKLKGDS